MWCCGPTRRLRPSAETPACRPGALAPGRVPSLRSYDFTNSKMTAITNTNSTSDSMKARPSSIAVWIRAIAPGCRAMASAAEPAARPCPRPQRPAARPNPRPAARTANAFAMSPLPAAAACAQARPGAARIAITLRVRMRCTAFLLVEGNCGLVVLGFLDRGRDVQHGQLAEDEGLDEGDQDLQRKQETHDEHDHDDRRRGPHRDASEGAGERPAQHPVEAHHEEEDGEQDVAGHHVAEEAEGQGERARAVADDLDHEHQRLQQGRDRAREVLH